MADLSFSAGQLVPVTSHKIRHCWFVTFSRLPCTGNDNLHLLTSERRQRLRVDLGDFDGNYRYAEYDDFAVESASAKYRLASIGKYTGNAGQYLISK